MNAQESLDSISQSEAEWIRETAYWDAVSNRKTIIGTAERRGLKQGIQQTARNFKNNGVSIEIISKCTGLSIEEVEAL